MISYPVYFYNLTCPHCASKGLQFLDRSGKTVKSLIYPVGYIVCNNCKRRFFIEWLDYEGKKVPVTCSRASIKDFEKEICKVSIENRRKI